MKQVNQSASGFVEIEHGFVITEQNGLSRQKGLFYRKIGGKKIAYAAHHRGYIQLLDDNRTSNPSILIAGIYATSEHSFQIDTKGRIQCL